MIFKTITNELGNTKLSINSSLNDLFSGDFFKNQSILSNSDISALEAYNAELNKVIGGDHTYEEFSKKIQEIHGTSRIRSDRDDTFILSGDLDDIHDSLLHIQSLAKDMGIDDSLLTDLSKMASETKNTLANYQELYSQHVLYDKIFDNQSYEEAFHFINDAYQKYQEAFAGGDTEAAPSAKGRFAAIMHEATANIDDSVIDYFHNMYPALMEEVGSWEFEVNFKSDPDSLAANVTDYISEFHTSDDIKNYNPKTDSDAITAGINALNVLLGTLNHVTDFFGSLGTIGLGAGLFAGIKNVGRAKRSALF